MIFERFEKLVIFLVSISFFIGIWHALPMLNVVNDEMYYVGGVLRAMQSYTLIPLQNDVPYGTLTYFVQYLMTIVLLIILFPFMGFNINALKYYLIENPSIAYFWLRFTSSILALSTLLIINNFFKKEGLDIKTRILSILIIFSNILNIIILHTGKMWVLSTLLVLISFYYLNKVLNNYNDRNLFLTIFFSFLALSNFPLNFYSLICLPILFFEFKNNKEILLKIFKYIFLGLFVYVLITLINFTGIKNQIISIFTEYRPITDESVNMNIFQSIALYLQKILYVYFLFLIMILVNIKNGLRNKKLFFISSIYFLTYLVVISFVANWQSDVRSSLRYIYPLGYFLIFILISIKIKINWFNYLITFVSIVFGLRILYLISVPTTYNLAYDFINKEYNSEEILIVNNISELQLIKNKKSYLRTKKEFCSTKCQNIIDKDLNSDVKYVVHDLLSTDNLLKEKNYLLVTEEGNLQNGQLIKSFENNSRYYHSIDYNLGGLDKDLFKIKNLGKNIYIYNITN